MVLSIYQENINRILEKKTLLFIYPSPSLLTLSPRRHEPFRNQPYSNYPLPQTTGTCLEILYPTISRLNQNLSPKKPNLPLSSLHLYTTALQPNRFFHQFPPTLECFRPPLPIFSHSRILSASIFFTRS